jgi:hypothetical protein
MHPCPPSSPRPLVCIGGRTTTAPSRILLKPFPPPLPQQPAVPPSFAESLGGTPPTSGSYRRRPGHRRPPRGAPHRLNIAAPPSFTAPPSTTLHSEPCYPPPCSVGCLCHCGARREDPPLVLSSVRRCVPRQCGRAGRGDHVSRACHACRASPGWAELAYGPGQQCRAVSGMWAEAGPAL